MSSPTRLFVLVVQSKSLPCRNNQMLLNYIYEYIDVLAMYLKRMVFFHTTTVILLGFPFELS